MDTVAHKTGFSAARRLAPWRALFQKFGTGGTPKLDLEILPDHLKRDLGLLGGRVSPPRDPLRD